MSLLATPLSAQLGIEVPLICGAMYPCSNPELVAAVSEAGGIGIDPADLAGLRPRPRVPRGAAADPRGSPTKPIGMNVIVEKSSQDLPGAHGALGRRRARGGRALLRHLARQPALGGGEGATRRAALVYHDVTERKWAEKGAGGGVDGLIARQRPRRRPRRPAERRAAARRAGRPRACRWSAPAASATRRGLRATRSRLGYAGVQMGTRFIATAECTRPRRLQAGDRRRGRGRHRAHRAHHRRAGGGDPHAVRRADRHPGRPARPLDAARPQDQALDAHVLRPPVALASSSARRCAPARTATTGRPARAWRGSRRSSRRATSCAASPRPPGRPGDRARDGAIWPASGGWPVYRPAWAASQRRSAAAKSPKSRGAQERLSRKRLGSIRR